MLDEYPKEFELHDGENVSLRILTRADEDRMLMFFLTIPESERNFLHYDVTDRETLDGWFGGPDWEEVFPLVAEVGGRIAGVGVLRGYRPRWAAHLGEAWMLVGESWRGLGISRIIANELFALANELGIEKLISEVCTDQINTVNIFKQMGFVMEGVRADFVKDADGRTRDLIMMACNVKEYWRRLEESRQDEKAFEWLPNMASGF